MVEKIPIRDNNLDGSAFEDYLIKIDEDEYFGEEEGIY